MKKQVKLFWFAIAALALLVMAAITCSAFDETQQAGTTYYYEVSYTDASGAKQVRGYATTLSDAVANAGAGDTVTVLADVTETMMVTVDKNLTIDGNEKTVAFTDAATITANGSDAVVLKNFNITVSNPFVTVNTGKLTISGCTVVGAADGTGNLVYAPTDGVTLEIADSTFTNNRATTVVWLGVEGGSTPNINATLQGVTIYNLNGKWSVYTGDAESLWVEDCYFSFTTETVDYFSTSTYAGVSTNGGIAGNATLTTVINSTVHGRNENRAIRNAKGVMNLYNVTASGYRALELDGGTTNVYDCTFYPNPGQQNHKMIDVQAASAVLNIYGGCFTVPGLAATKTDIGLLCFTQAGTVNIYDGSFTDSNTKSGKVMINMATAGELNIKAAGTTYKNYAGESVSSRGVTLTRNGAAAVFATTKGTVTVGAGTVITLTAGASVLSAGSGSFAIDGAKVYVNGGVLPADDAMWETTQFTLMGEVSSVTLESGDAVSFDSEHAAILEAQRIFLKPYSSNQYIKIGKNLTAEGVTALTPFVIGEGATLFVTDGSYTVDAPLFTVEGGTLTVTGGSFTMTANDRHIMLYSGKVSISGADTVFTCTASCTSGRGFLYMEGGALEIADGTFTLQQGGSLIRCAGTGTISISGGTFTKVSSTASDTYSDGAIVYFSGTDITPTLTITGGTFTSHSFVRIYTTCTSTDADGNTLYNEGVKVYVRGGEFIDNATSKVHTDRKYLFQIAYAGKHLIEMTGEVTVKATNYTYIFNCNSQAAYATFNIHGGTYEGGRAWIATNREYTTISVKNATFKDVTGAMNGVTGSTGSVIYCDVDVASSIEIENTSFTLKTPDLVLFKWDGQADFSITNSRVVAPQLLYATAARSFDVENCLFIITENDHTVFDNANTTLKNTVVLAPKGTAVFGKYLLTAHAADVSYAGVTYKSFVTMEASGENAPVLQKGAQLYVSTEATETSGIRFNTTISAETIVAIKANEKYAGATYKYYTLIAPADYVAAAGAFTKEALAGLGYAVPYVAIPAVNTLVDSATEGVSFSGALVNLKSNTRAYAAVAYIEIVNANNEVIDTIYGAYCSFDNARTAEQIADTIIFENEEYKILSNAEKKIVDTYADGVAHELEGKRIIFIGDSFVYYGQTVLEKSQSVLEQSARENDHGYFYQLCRANGIEVSVTNWTLGGHGLANHCAESCAADRGCDGENHLSYLLDRYYDYVVISGGRASSTTAESHFACIEQLMDVFRSVNPNAKFLYLVSSGAHNVSVNPTLPVNILNNLDVLEDKYGFTIVDWGAIVADIISGAVSVPGATESYNKNSFAVHWSATDGYHPNQLAGYITTLMTYCAITGESAVGQTYDFWNDTSLKPVGLKDYFFDADAFVAKYYTKGETNYPAIFASPADMLGLQQLVDRYLAEKSYRDYNFEPLS